MPSNYQRGLPYMTSGKMDPPVTYRNHLIVFLLSAFWGPPAPPPLRTSYMEASKCRDPWCDLSFRRPESVWYKLNLQKLSSEAVTAYTVLTTQRNLFALSTARQTLTQIKRGVKMSWPSHSCSSQIKLANMHYVLRRAYKSSEQYNKGPKKDYFLLCVSFFLRVNQQEHHFCVFCFRIM